MMIIMKKRMRKMKKIRMLKMIKRDLLLGANLQVVAVVVFLVLTM